MRLLLSFILSCFFFAAPLQGKAANAPMGKQENVAVKIPKAGLVQDERTNASPAIITSSVQHNNYSTRNNFFSLTNFINTVCCISSATAFPAKKRFPHSYLYCKPIGLKLVFPRHYFW